MSKAFVTVDSVFVIYTERGRVFIEFLNSFFFLIFLVEKVVAKRKLINYTP